MEDLGYLVLDKDRDRYIDLFISELEKGLKGKKSSLNTLPSFVRFPDKVTSLEKVAVLCADKVTFIKGNFKTSGDRFEVYGTMGYPMPGLSKEISLEAFFRRIIFEARDVLRNCNKIGWCFGHPMEANAKGDGKLLGWARGSINVPELVGKFIGEEFCKYLKKDFDKDYKIILLNDTIATLIAGLVETHDKEFEDFIGLVHSDGYNLSYIEEGKNLKDVISEKKYLKSQMVLNTQAGSFNKIRDSKIDKEIKSLLGDILIGEFSQKVNSKCIPLAFDAIIRELSGSILNAKVSSKLSEINDLDLEQMYCFLKVGLKSSSDISSVFRCATLADAVNVGLIIDQIFQRAARLVAVQICGILKYKDIGHNPIQPVGIIVEGDFFDIVKDFEHRIRCEIKQYFHKEDPRYIQFLRVPNATLLGAGIAAASNL